MKPRSIPENRLAKFVLDNLKRRRVDRAFGEHFLQKKPDGYRPPPIFSARQRLALRLPPGRHRGNGLHKRRVFSDEIIDLLNPDFEPLVHENLQARRFARAETHARSMRE